MEKNFSFGSDSLGATSQSEVFLKLLPTLTCPSRQFIEPIFWFKLFRKLDDDPRLYIP